MKRSFSLKDYKAALLLSAILNNSAIVRILNRSTGILGLKILLYTSCHRMKTSIYLFEIKYVITN